MIINTYVILCYTFSSICIIRFIISCFARKTSAFWCPSRMSSFKDALFTYSHLFPAYNIALHRRSLVSAYYLLNAFQFAFQLAYFYGGLSQLFLQLTYMILIFRTSVVDTWTPKDPLSFIDMVCIVLQQKETWQTPTYSFCARSIALKFE